MEGLQKNDIPVNFLVLSLRLLCDSFRPNKLSTGGASAPITVYVGEPGTGNCKNEWLGKM